jgi:hypothetical protein
MRAFAVNLDRGGAPDTALVGLYFERLFRLESMLAVATFVFFAMRAELLRWRVIAAALAGALYLAMS